MRLMRARGEYFADLIAPHVDAGASVLDLGCGDLQIATALSARVRGARVLGLDVLDPGRTAPLAAGIDFRTYDGHVVPLPDRSVDVTYLAFVLHHVDDPDRLLREAIRVTRTRVIVLEDVYRHRAERLLLKAFDLGNLLQAPRMHLPFHFRSEAAWLEAINALGVARVDCVAIRPAIPKPTRHRKFVVTI
jgi:SAM-dependent methyltransferase